MKIAGTIEPYDGKVPPLFNTKIMNIEDGREIKRHHSRKGL